MRLFREIAVKPNSPADVLASHQSEWCMSPHWRFLADQCLKALDAGNPTRLRRELDTSPRILADPCCASDSSITLGAEISQDLGRRFCPEGAQDPVSRAVGSPGRARMADRGGTGPEEKGKHQRSEARLSATAEQRERDHTERRDKITLHLFISNKLFYLMFDCATLHA